MKTCAKLKAYAKVNLLLRVCGKRSDGYHSLVSVMQGLDLGDDLEVRRIEGSIDLEVLPQEAAPAGEDNLAWKALALLHARTGGKVGFACTLGKLLPLGGGLGGGSSDAAAALRCGNALLDRPLDEFSLKEAAVSLGSDVPFFLQLPIALVEGRGEFVKPLARPAGCWFVLAIPPVGCPTAQVYAYLADRFTPHKQALEEARALAGALAAGASAAEIAPLLHNDLEEPALETLPLLKHLKQVLLKVSARAALVSGSGSTVFGLADDADHAHYIAELAAKETGGVEFLPVAALQTRPEVSECN